MNAKHTLNSDALSTTALLPLWAKAVESQRPDALLRDAHAVRLMNSIDYDFSQFAKAHASQVGCCGRARWLDNITQQFIAQHPDAVIVQLGAGLDARFERLNCPQITAWYDLDLPEVIALRRQLLPENGNHYIATSLFDTAWMDTVAQYGKPILLLAEGVLMYFAESEIKALFQTLAQKMPQAQIAFDVVAPMMVGKAKQHDALGKMGEAPPEFKFTLRDEADLANWQNVRVLAFQGLSEVCQTRYPWWLRLIYRSAWGRKQFDMRLIHCQLNPNSTPAA